MKTIAEEKIKMETKLGAGEETRIVIRQSSSEQIFQANTQKSGSVREKKKNK